MFKDLLATGYSIWAFPVERAGTSHEVNDTRVHPVQVSWVSAMLSFRGLRRWHVAIYREGETEREQTLYPKL